MLSLFKKQAKGYVGMELATSQLRMVELSGTKDKPVLERYAIVEIPTEMYSNNEVHDQLTLGKLIKDTFAKGFSNKRIALAMPSSQVITKEFNIPESASPDEQMEIVQTEVQNTVPLDLDEIYIDYKVLPTSKEEGTFEAAFAVSKKEHVDDRVGALEIAGLEAKIVDSEHNAMMYSVDAVLYQQLQIEEEENVLVVHTTKEKTEYMVFRSSRLIWVRDTNLSAKTLLDAISLSYGVDANEAQAMAFNPDNYTEAYERLKVDTIQPFIDSISLEINKHIEMFNESGVSFSIQRILISGELAAVAEIDETINAQNNIETHTINALAHCELGSKIDMQKLIEDVSLLTIAMGMALRTFE